MHIIIDIGNSSAKIALFREGEIHYKTHCDTGVLDEVKGLFSKYPEIKCSVLSSVEDCPEGLLSYLSANTEFSLVLSGETFLPITNEYKTPGTLGKDRLAAVVGASSLYPESDILVVDAGTAITFDFIDKNKKYHGGTISPGLQMRFRALNAFTKKLPLLSPRETFDLLGNSTDCAIVSGVQNGCIFEIDEYISTLNRKYEGLVTILTGGDTVFFENKLKNRIFANRDLVLLGLNTILVYNLNLKH